MSIFGQVWLWSAAAFLVGVLLTWLVLVRPVQAKNRTLERRLQAALAAPAPEPSLAPSATVVEPVPEHHDPYPPLPEPTLFAGPAEEGPEPAEQPRSDAESSERLLSEAELTDDRAGSTWFTDEHGAPEAPERERTEQPQPTAPEFAGISSILEPERDPDTELTSVFSSVNDQAGDQGTNNSPPVDAKPTAEDSSAEPIADKGSERGTLFDPDDPASAELAGLTAAEPQPEPPAYAFSGDSAAGPDESATETTQVLPRRQPRPVVDEPATPAAPPMRSVERREPVEPDAGGRSGSLFEPVQRDGQAAAESAPTPPPARTPTLTSAVPPGPFGPGSAMPRPGGGQPSEEFTVKASVTALRYCTEDSPHYGRMIAEVWFRTPADAERVGFRPLA